MPTRRDFLKTTAAVAVSAYLPGVAAAQQQAPGSETFADFESGTYEGWKLEGNCWGVAPASEQSFSGRITGFQGKRFLCTLHPIIGTGATGKAI